MKLLVVDRIQPQSNKFATGVKNEATGDSKLNDSPALVVSIDKHYLSNRPQVSMCYKLINHMGCW